MVCRLNKTLHGFKQASHDWYELLCSYLISIGFSQCDSDTCIFVKRSESGGMIIVGVFVDDMCIAYAKEDEQEWLDLKSKLLTRFKIKDLGELKLILGMRVTRNRKLKTLTIDNEVQIKATLKTFGMDECKSASTPESLEKLEATTDADRGKVDKTLFQSMVGALNYLVQSCRPDISHAVNSICRYANNPGPTHYTAAKRILRYLSGTSSLGLTLAPGCNGHGMNVVGWSDSDWGGDLADRKSTTGYVVKIGNNTVSWATKKQQTVALSTGEAEYMAISAVAQEILWIRSLLKEILGGNSTLITPSIVY